MAAEIAEHYPEKEVIIVHSHPKLMGRMPKAAITYTERWLERRRVKLYMSEKVTELIYPPSSTLASSSSLPMSLTARTDKGREILADMAFLCTGIVPNSGFLQDHFSPCLSKSGYVKVNQHLQMTGKDNVFVCGDVADIQEEKLAQSAEVMGAVVVDNLVKIADAQESAVCEQGGAQLSTYVSATRPVLVSLGQYDGIFVYKNWVFSGFIPALLKEAVEWKTMVRYW